jgi:hypothetical protein
MLFRATKKVRDVRYNKSEVWDLTGWFGGNGVDLFGRCLVRYSAGTSAILVELFFFLSAFPAQDILGWYHD